MFYCQTAVILHREMKPAWNIWKWLSPYVRKREPVQHDGWCEVASYRGWIKVHHILRGCQSAGEAC